jgi:hypothetical protein
MLLSTKRNLVLAGLFFVSVGFVGCNSKQTIRAKVSVMRAEGGKFLAVSSSATEALAYDGAKARAEEQCFKDGKDFVVVNEESKYQGADQTTKGIASTVSTLFGKGSDNNSIDDYKVKVTFKCEGKYTGKGAPFPETLDLSVRTTTF